MRERAEELGGAVTISSAAPGVIVTAQLPVLATPARASVVPVVPAWLATLPDVEVAATVGTAEEALAGLGDSAPDIVLMDINLPGASGVEATRAVLAAAPATAVLVISMVDDDDSVFAALAAGARGYLLKGASADEITAALRTVAAGGAVFRIPARRSDRTGTRGTRPARRGCQQPANRPHFGSLPENSAEPRRPHPRQAPGRRPDLGRPASPRHLAAALSTGARSIFSLRSVVSDRPLLEPVQCGLRDLVPAVVDGQRVAPIGELDEIGDGR
jgi:DNA-binding NarL/FixJ family response regulator